MPSHKNRAEQPVALVRSLSTTRRWGVFASLLSVCGGLVGFGSAAQAVERFGATSLALTMDATSDVTAFGLRIAKPIMLSERSLLMPQVSGMMGDGGFGIVSAGLAYRRMIGNSGTYAGVNVFYDAMKNENGFSYSQIGLGGEVARGRWTLRGNAYLPIGDHSTVDSQSRVRRENEIITATDNQGRLVQTTTSRDWLETTTQKHTGAWSWEVELEYALRQGPVFLDPRVAVGYYQIGGDSAAEEFSGLKARAELRVGEHFVADAEWHQDAGPVGQEWRAGVRWEMTLGAPAAAIVKTDTDAKARHSDGKTMRDGKGVMPMSDGKFGPPMEPNPPVAENPPGFYAPVHRTPWPMVLSSESFKSRLERTRVNMSVLSAKSVKNNDCCADGATLIFN